MSRLIAFLILTSPAFAADKALILNDQEQSAMSAIFDAAIKASGLSPLSRNAMILQDKMLNAAVVTEHKDNPPAAEKKD